MRSTPRSPGEPGVRIDPALDQFVRSEVNRQLGGSRVDHVDTLQVDAHSAVLRVTVQPSSRRVVLKVSGPGDQRAIDYQRTAAVMELARAAGVPVPAVLAVDTSRRAGPWRYLILEHADGVEWRHVRPRLDDGELRAAHRQIAETLLAIQSVRLDSFGAVAGQHAPQDLLSALRRRAARLITDERTRAAFSALLDRETGLFTSLDQTPTLSHDDLHHGNVIFRPDRGGGWQLSGVLDWDKAWAGPAESDVARMAFWDDMTGPGFWEVYRGAVPVIDGLDRRMLIYQLLWCLEYGKSTDRHRSDTETLRQRLGTD